MNSGYDAIPLVHNRAGRNTEELTDRCGAHRSYAPSFAGRPQLRKFMKTWVHEPIWVRALRVANVTIKPSCWGHSESQNAVYLKSWRSAIRIRGAPLFSQSVTNLFPQDQTETAYGRSARNLLKHLDNNRLAERMCVASVHFPRTRLGS